MNNISLADVRALEIALPPRDEQVEIVRRLDAIFDLADDIEKQVVSATSRAERLMQAILAKAFRGQLVPTEAELARQEGRAYEPAALLLDRIRKEQETVASSRSKARKTLRSMTIKRSARLGSEHPAERVEGAPRLRARRSTKA